MILRARECEVRPSFRRVPVAESLRIVLHRRVVFFGDQPGTEPVPVEEKLGTASQLAALPFLIGGLMARRRSPAGIAACARAHTVSSRIAVSRRWMSARPVGEGVSGECQAEMVSRVYCSARPKSQPVRGKR